MGTRIRRWLALALLGGCSAAPPPIEDVVAPPDTIDVSPESSEPPTSAWRYHPRQAAAILGGAELTDGRWLLVTELGERWLTDGPPRGADGREVIPLGAEAAAHRAGEPLEHVVPWRPRERGIATGPSDARWLFIGESGRTYFAREPLGPLTAGPTAPGSVAAASPTRTGAIVLDVVGRSLRFDGAAFDPQSEQDRPRLFAIAQRRDGQLLAMSLPERYWRSDDDGDGWSPLATSPVGALRLVTDRAGEVLADGTAGAWRIGSNGDVSPSTEPPIHPTAVVLDPPDGPSAEAVIEGGAALTPDGYVALVSTDAGWHLLEGRLGERLDARALSLEVRCDRPLVSRSDAHLWIACRDESEEPSKLRLFYSPDRGRSLGRVTTVFSRLPERVSVTSDGDGAVLVTAVCPRHRPACPHGGPLRVRPDGRVEPTVAPELRGPGFEAASGRRGRRYFLGERAKDHRVALFVSNDGERFAAQPFEPPRHHRGTWDRELTTRRTLHPAADGTIGIVIHGATPGYAVADERGRIDHVATLPENTVAVGGHGQRVMALTKVGPFEIGAHQSSDGGRTFRSVALPMALETSELDEPRVACGTAGCIIGDRVTRVGWGADQDRTPSSIPPELTAREDLPAIRTPISCTVDGVAATLTNVAAEPALPAADAVMRGDVAWSVLRRIRATGQVEVAAMTRSAASSSRLVRHRLLPPSTPRERWATDVALGPEGDVAVRAKLPPSRDRLAGAPMALEIAWYDGREGTVHRAALPDAGVFTDASVTPGRFPTLVSGALALASPGLMIQPSMERADTWVVDAKGTARSHRRLPDFPPTAAALTTLDAVYHAGTFFALQRHHLDAYASSAAVVTVAPLAGSSSATSTTTVAVPALGRIYQTHLSQRDGRPGIVSHSFGPSRDDVFGYFAPLLDTGRFAPAQAIPTQRDLGDPPSACTPSQRRLGLRVVAPFQAGTRHPVLVRDGNRSIVLLTERAVIQSTPEGPCLSGWVAVSIGQDPQRLAVVSGDLEGAWLLQQAGAAALEHVPLRCTLTPDAEVPEAVWRESGTLSVSP